MTKVLFLGLKIFSTGGIEQVCKNWLHALTILEQKKKITFRALSMHDENIDKHYISNSKIELFSSGKWKFGFKAILTAVQSDIVIIPHLHLSLFVLIAKLINPKLKIYTQVHGIEVWGNLSGVQERMLLQSERILAVSSFTRDSIVNRYPELSNKVIVLPNSLDPFKKYSIDESKREKFRKKLGISDTQKLIITVGRIRFEEAYKGYDKTIEALQLLKDDNISFHIIGKYDDIEKQRIFEYLIKYDLIGQVKLVGYVSEEELDSYYQAADLFVMPSKGEGFGLVFIDAMAHGLRVIGGNVDGSVDAIEKIDANGLVDPNNIVEISEKIKLKLAEGWTAENRLQLSENCKSHFSKEVFEKNIESIIG